MAPRLPIPRITLKRRPSSRNDSPGLSSVPASIEPIITLSAPAASALTTSPEYLMPPSAITGTSPAPVTAYDRRDLRDADAGDDAGGADRARTHTNLHRVHAALDQRARARLRRHVPAHQLRVGVRLAQAGHGLEHAFGVPMRRVHDDHVAPRIEERAGARQRIGRPAHCRSDAQPAVLILVGVGVPPALEDVLDGDQTL